MLGTLADILLTFKDTAISSEWPDEAPPCHIPKQSPNAVLKKLHHNFWNKVYSRNAKDTGSFVSEGPSGPLIVTSQDIGHPIFLLKPLHPNFWNILF